MAGAYRASVRGHLLIDVPLAATGLACVPEFGWGAFAAAAGAASVLHTWAVIDPRCGLYMPVTWRLRADAPGCALTFDDGPNPEVTPRLLDALAAAGARATFFVVGSHVRAQPALVRRIRAEGHALGLHSDTHSRRFNCWGPWRVRRDLEACGAAIADATGEAPPRLFRPPVGLKNPIVGHVSLTLGLRTVTWSARGRDARSADPEAVARRLDPAIRPGAILVMHDGHEPGRPGTRDACVGAIERLAPRLREVRSYALMPLARGVGLDVALTASSPTPAAASPSA